MEANKYIIAILIATPFSTCSKIIELFDLKPSKEVGILKSAVKDAILDGHISNNKEEAKRFLLEKAKEMGLSPKQ